MLETAEETCREVYELKQTKWVIQIRIRIERSIDIWGLPLDERNLVRKDWVLISLKPRKHRTRGESKVQLHGVVSSRKTTKQSSES